MQSIQQIGIQIFKFKESVEKLLIAWHGKRTAARKECTVSWNDAECVLSRQHMLVSGSL